MVFNETQDSRVSPNLPFFLDQGGVNHSFASEHIQPLPYAFNASRCTSSEKPLPPHGQKRNAGYFFGWRHILLGSCLLPAMRYGSSLKLFSSGLNILMFCIPISVSVTKTPFIPR